LRGVDTEAASEATNIHSSDGTSPSTIGERGGGAVEELVGRTGVLSEGVADRTVVVFEHAPRLPSAASPPSGR